MGVNTKASLSTGQKHYRLSICSPRTRPSKGIVRQGSSICLTSKLEQFIVELFNPLCSCYCCIVKSGNKNVNLIPPALNTSSRFRIRSQLFKDGAEGWLIE